MHVKNRKTTRHSKKKKKSRRKHHKRHKGRKSRRPKARGFLTSPLRTYRIWKHHYENKKKRATLRRKRRREARERFERELLEAPSIASTPSSFASIPTFYSQTSTPLSATIPSQSNSTSSSLLSDKSTPDTLPEFLGPSIQQGGKSLEEKDLPEKKQDKEDEHDQKKSWFDVDFGNGLFGTWFTEPPKNEHGIWSSNGMTCRPWLPFQCPGGGKCVGTGLGIGNFSFKGKCMSP